MNKSHLLAVCIIFASLAGYTQSANATTLFGINFDFQASGEDTGGMFLQFDVDPQALPFDQWIDLTSDPSVQFDLWVSGIGALSGVALIATEEALSASSTVFGMEVYVEDANPIFPVLVGATLAFWDPIFLSINGEANDDQIRLRSDGVYVLQTRRFGRIIFQTGTWTAAMWFDSPIPAVVPIPAAVWLFGSGLGLLGWMKRKRA